MIVVVLALVAALVVQSWLHRLTVRSVVDVAADEKRRQQEELRRLVAALVARHGGEAQLVLRDRRPREPKAHEDPIHPEGL